MVAKPLGEVYRFNLIFKRIHQLQINFTILDDWRLIRIYGHLLKKTLRAAYEA